MQQFSELPPLGLYIHFPWCVKKCPYCDFNSHTVKDTLPEQEYVACLLADLDQQLPQVWGRRVNSIFMGGGTPSLFSAGSLDKLICALRARLNFRPDIEITLEANPGTVEQEKFSDFRRLGINRLSIGVQSFNNKHLQQLGRIHNAQEAIKAIEVAHKAGFEKLNIDLMYGLPGQTLGEATADVQMALALSPTHLSHYQLTIEPNTWFQRHPPMLPDDDRIAEFETSCRELLEQNGFERYEISAFARPDQQSEHNINYWQFGDYLGLGAGAHGKITGAPNQQIQRNWQVKHPRDYLKAKNTAQRTSGKQILTEKETAFEFFLNVFRLVKGFNPELFQQRCGLPIACVEKPLQIADSKDLIDWGQKRIVPTESGLQYLNDLTGLFLPDSAD